MADPVKLVRVEVEVVPPDLTVVVDAAMRDLRAEFARIEQSCAEGEFYGRKAIVVTVRPSAALLALLSCPGAFEPVTESA